MDDWRRAVNDYQNGVQSIAQSNLQSKESLLQSKAGLITANIGQKEGMTAEKFADKLKEEGMKFQESLGVEFSASSLVPLGLKGAARLASWRANALNRSWRTTQATRFNEQENAGDLSGEGGVPSVSAPEPPSVRTPGFGSVDETDPFQPGMTTRIPVRPMQRLANIDPEPEPTQLPDEGAVPNLTDAAETPYTDSLPSYARGISKTGQALRQYARGGLQGGTSDNIGDAINEASESGTPSGRATLTKVATDDDPLEGTGLKLSTQIDDVSQEASKATTQAAQEASSVSDEIGDVSKSAGAEAGEAVEDLAPEISEAASTWSSVAGVIGDAIPVVGTALTLWSAISSGMDLAKTIKDQSTDPYASIRGQITSAQNKIQGLQADVSADEFASKIGSRAPAFGSLAAAPQMAQQMGGGIALHI